MNWLINFLILLCFQFALVATSAPASDQLTPDGLCLEGTRFSATYGLGVENGDIDHENLIEICSMALDGNPENLDLKFGLARSIASSGDTKKASKMFHALSNLGHADSTDMLADFYYFGTTGQRSLKKFFEFSVKAYELGSFYGALNLYHAYYEGLGVQDNDEQAVVYLEEAAANGVSQAVVILADALAYGKFGFEQDKARAKKIILDEMSLGNPSAEATYHQINIDFPDNKFDLLLSLKRLDELAKYGDQDATWLVAKINLLPIWYDDVGKKFGVEMDAEKGEKLLLQLTETSYGISLLSDIFVPKLGDNVSSEVAQELEKRLRAIAEDPSIFDRKSAILAARLLAFMNSQAIFGPANKDDELHFLKLAADRYGDAEAQVDLGWFYWSEPNFYDFEKALEYSELATQSNEPIMQAYGYNNIGVFYSYPGFKQLEAGNADSISEENFLKAAELFEDSDFLNPWVFDNLARLSLFRNDQEIIDIEKFRHYAALSDNKGGSGFFSDLIDRYPLKGDTESEEIKNWFKKEARNGTKAAYLELAFLSEEQKDIIDAVKWFSICRVLCEEEDRGMSQEALNRLQMTTRGAVFIKAENLANLWLSENLASASLARPATANTTKAYPKQLKNKKLKLEGVFYALLIGISRYDGLDSLATPIKDIRAVGELLEKKYQANTTYLENANRRDITVALNKLKKITKEQDAVLIYYAGHGLVDQDTDEGYWLPKDAEADDDTNYISNSYVRNKIKGMRAKNVLLVADSCFSGSIVTRGVRLNRVAENTVPNSALEKYLKTKSRIAITSGGLKPVMDGGGGQHSVFAKSFIDALAENENPTTSSELYLRVRDKVTETSIALGVDQTPVRGELPNGGHEGPDFVFLPN